MIKIGDGFAAELTAAGVTDRRFAWGDDGEITFDPRVAQAERDKVMAVLAAHDPASPAPAPAAPLDAEELFDMLKLKGVLADADRPRPKPGA